MKTPPFLFLTLKVPYKADLRTVIVGGRRSEGGLFWMEAFLPLDLMAIAISDCMRADQMTWRLSGGFIVIDELAMLSDCFGGDRNLFTAMPYRNDEAIHRPCRAFSTTSTRNCCRR